MTMIEKLNVLMAKRGLNRKQLSEQSKIPYMTIVNFYEKGTENVKLSTLKKLANFFNVSLDYIADDDFEDDRNKHQSKSELEHIEKYRLLSPEGQKAADKTLEAILELEQISRPTQIPNNIIPLRISEQPASAGTGTYLGPESFRTVYVLDNEMTDHTAFAVPVSGNSMEPRYHDGDILLVADEPMEVGDVGLFTLDGCGYVKKLGDGELISLNRDYRSIPMDDSVICNGKVIAVLDKDWIAEK